jgi:palmitoyltransferase ZDHHC9/14/18
MTGFLCCCANVAPKEEQRKLDNIFHWRPQRIGNSYLLCGKKNTSFPQQLFIGPEWPCMIITNVLIILPTYFFIVNVASEVDVSVMIIAMITGTVLLIMFASTACSEPGIVWTPGEFDGTQAKSPEDKLETGFIKPINSSSTGAPQIMCGQCQLDRPRTASHCYECGLCVDELDHHCPWTGKCIAKKNLQRFHYFLWSMCVHIVFVVGTLVYSVSD